MVIRIGTKHRGQIERAIGSKRIETRSWPTSCRGPVLICAAKRKNKGELAGLFETDAFRSALADEPLAYGNAVCLVNLHSCLPAGSVWKQWGTAASPDENFFGNYDPGRYAWLTSNLRRLKPFPVTGHQGFFEVTLPDFEDW